MHCSKMIVVEKICLLWFGVAYLKNMGILFGYVYLLYVIIYYFIIFYVH